MSKFVEYRVNGPLGEVCLNRPHKLNAINAAMRSALHDVLDRAAADDAVRVLLLHGQGRAFSAGFDLDIGQPEDGESHSEFLRRELSRDFELIMRFHDFVKPSVAAVHGYCLGSSMEISAVCDLTVAASGCQFGAPEVRYGSGIVCMILPWIIGQKHARELLLTGSDRVDAERAAAIGLVNRVVPENQLLATARGLAMQIAENDPYAVQMTRKALNQSLQSAGLREALAAALEIDVQIEGHDSEESREFNRILAEDGPGAALAWRRAMLQGDRRND